MKTANGYLELDNPTPGANNLTITIIERLDSGEIRQAIAKIDPSKLGAFITGLLSLRGIVDEVDQQRPAKTVEVEKIVQQPVIAGDDLIAKLVNGVKAVLQTTDATTPTEPVTPEQPTQPTESTPAT